MSNFVSRYAPTLLALSAAAVLATGSAVAQSSMQQDPAPIVHSWDSAGDGAQSTNPAAGMHYADQQMQGQAAQDQPMQDGPDAGGPPMHERQHRMGHRDGIKTDAPVQGVWARATHGSGFQTVSAQSGGTTELRIAKGKLNVVVNHPAANSQILVDLPGGQTALVKDGFYTFNADTNTVRVIAGNAETFPGNGAKGYKVDAAQQFVFGSSAHAADVNREQAASDVLAGGRPRQGEARGEGYGEGGYGEGGYGGAYAEGYGASPYYAWGTPYDYAWGYPFFGYGLGYGYGYGGYGYGYPGFGFGLGYGGFGYGGFGYGGYGYGGYGHGGWDGKFHSGGAVSGGGFRGSSAGGGFHGGSSFGGGSSHGSSSHGGGGRR
jgi:hypothetical protein